MANPSVYSCFDTGYGINQNEDNLLVGATGLSIKLSLVEGTQ